MLPRPNHHRVVHEEEVEIGPVRELAAAEFAHADDDHGHGRLAFSRREVKGRANLSLGKLGQAM